MKKILTGFLCILLCISIVPEVLAADIGDTDSNKSLNWDWASRDISFENDIALKMEQIRLIQGVGKREDGTTDFGLERQVTRMQAVLMPSPPCHTLYGTFVLLCKWELLLTE